MEIEPMSQRWQLLLTAMLAELQPVTCAREHYAGDECWCVPNRLKIRDMQHPDAILTVWVHAGDSVEDSEDMTNAINGVIDFWQGIIN